VLIVVSPAGPTLWQRIASGIVSALVIAVPAVLLLKYTGEHHDPATNYNPPTVSTSTFPGTVTDVPPLPITGASR